MMIPPTSDSQNGGWKVISVDKTQAGLNFYMSHVRPFRLRMLQINPEAFSSTIARESAFDDERWKRRVLDPASNTFVAIRGTGIGTDIGGDENERVIILSMLCLRGPFPMTDESRLVEALRQSGWGDLAHTGKQPLLRWEVYSVFTDPGARRRGVGAAVLAAAMQHALAESIKVDADCVLVLGILGHDGGVRSFYEKAGFRVLGEDEEGGLELVRCMSKDHVGVDNL